MSRRLLTIAEVKQRIFDKHEDLVTLDESTYKNITSKARFIDKEFGEFWAIARVITMGYRHPKRGKHSFKVTAEEVERRIKAIHGDRISFNKDDYKNLDTKIWFTDKEYGPWFTKPHNLVNGYGNPERARIGRMKPLLIRHTEDVGTYDIAHLNIDNKNIISGIYCILNTRNNKKYIGSSDNVRKRFNEHKYLLRKNKHHSLHLQRAWNLDKEESFSFLLIELVPIDKIIEKEQYWINYYNSANDKYGYNTRAIAESNRGHKFIGIKQKRRDDWKKIVSEEELFSFYGEGNSATDCSIKFNPPISIVIRVLQEANIMRSRSEASNISKARKKSDENRRGKNYNKIGYIPPSAGWNRDNWKEKVSLDDLISLYKKGLIIKELAEKFNICAPIISRILRENNCINKRGKHIPWNKESWKSKVSEEELVLFYKNAHSILECKERFDISVDSVRMILQRNGTMRTRKETRDLKVQNKVLAEE